MRNGGRLDLDDNDRVRNTQTTVLTRKEKVAYEKKKQIKMEIRVWI